MVLLLQVSATVAALPENNDASAELTTAKGRTACLISMYLMQKNMSACPQILYIKINFIRMYNIQKYVKCKLITFRPVRIARSVTDVLLRDWLPSLDELIVNVQPFAVVSLSVAIRCDTM